VIPAGGSGTRLWPRSRRHRPKHLLSLPGRELSLLRETYDRARAITPHVVVLTEERQLGPIREQLPELDADDLIVEPSPRGTTSALGLAALTLAERDPEAVMLSMAADHVIGRLEEWARAVRLAAEVASSSGSLVTVGLRPRHPATGYGYIRALKPALGREDVLTVDRFVEKPDQVRAREYLAAGVYYWNLNMFSWRVSSFLEELARLEPEHHAGLLQVLEARRRGDQAAAAEIYGRLPTEAVDYTVLERTDRLLLVPAAFDWDDVGSWAELYEILERDQHGNATEGDVVLVDTETSLVLAPDRLVAAIGLKDMIVVVSDDAILVCPKSQAQQVKQVAEQLRRDGRLDYL